jgi:hypothetical protein
LSLVDSLATTIFYFHPRKDYCRHDANIKRWITNAEEGIKKLEEYVGLGSTEIVLTNSSPDREKLVKLNAKEIAPALK